MPRRRRPHLDRSFLDICLTLCDEKIAALQRQRDALVAERDAELAARAARPPRADTPSPEKIMNIVNK
jgi:hypothetical protein